MQLVLNKLNESYLSQSVRLAAQGPLAVAATTRPAAFTTALTSSLTFEEVMEMRYGDFNIDNVLALLIAQAKLEDKSLSEILNDFYAYFRQNFLMHSTLLSYVTLATGSSNRPVAPKHIARQPATQILKVVKKEAADERPVFTMIMTDWVAHVYAQLGWLLPEFPVAYKIPRHSQYPGLEDLVDAVELCKARRFLQAVRSVDLTIVRQALSEPTRDGNLGAGAISPSLISQYMAHATTAASDTLRGQRNATDITRAVLNVLLKRWDPELPPKAEDNHRVTDDTTISEMGRNITLFFAAQELALQGLPVPTFTDSEMIDEVIGTFSEAISTHPVFAKRNIADTVGHLGVKQAKDHMNRPIFSVLYENWKVDSSITVFDPIRVDKDGDLRFLLTDSTLSSRLSDALGSAMATMDLNSIVSRRIGAYEAMDYQHRLGATHGSVSIVSPTVAEAIASSNLTHEEQAIVRSLTALPTPAVLTDLGVSKQRLEVVLAIAKSILRDHYITLMHYAVAYSDAVVIGRGMSSDKALSSKAKHRAVLALAFQHSAHFKAPIGSAAIIAGRVQTCEPLEVMAYALERSPAVTLERKSLNLGKSENALHSWGWHSVSEPVSHVTQEYVTELSGTSYVTRLRAQDALGSGHISQRLRFVKPTIANAIVSLWFDVFTDITSFYDALKQSDNSGITEEAIAARKSSHALQLVAHLRRLGSTVIGQNAQSFVYNSLVNDLIDSDRIDSITELQRGVERVRFEAWCGFAVITQLGLLDVVQRTALYNFIRDNQAIANAVAMEDNYS